MKRVGILTFHHVHNFGAVLQAWSVADAVRRLGHTPVVINYQPVIGHEKARTGWRRFVPSLGKLRNQQFVKRHIPLSGPPLEIAAAVSEHVDRAGYDVLVCGSDQVWMIYPHQGVDAPYFLGVGTDPSLRRVAYAPSAGSTTSFGAFSDEVTTLLRAFDAVSVRDENTRKAVSGVGIDKVTRVVDPTLIADFSPLVPSDPARQDIVVVGAMNAAADRYISWAAKVLNCKVRSMGTRSGVADRQRPFASPTEWLREVAGAKLVITSLFHGAAVSMSLRTPFVALDCGGRAFKLEDFCGFFDIPERLLTRTGGEDYAQDPALLELEYAKINPRLEAAIAASTAYLDAAIRG